MNREYALALMTEEEAKEAFSKRQVIILPVGSLEQHGPHLPAATDAVIAERISLAIANEVEGIVLPTISYGNSFSWVEGWTSTISLSQGRLAEVIYDIGKAVAQKGGRYFVIFNGHGSNPPDLIIGSKRLKEDYNDLEILIVEWWAAGASAISSSKESDAESHSGEFETSVMMYLAPEMVRKARFIAGYPDHLPSIFYQYLIVKSGGGDKIKRIQSYSPSVNASGVYGDPSRATKEKGEGVVKRVVENVQKALHELENMRNG